MKYLNFFDHARHHPWLLGLLIVVVVGLVILIEAGTIEGFGNRRGSPAELAELSDAEQSARLTVMNIVNRFNLGFNAATATSTRGRAEETLTRVSATRTRLSELMLPRTIQPVQRDLIRLFDTWGSYLHDGEDTTLLRDDFLNVGASYPWLSTLLWIIVLNRL